MNRPNVYLNVEELPTDRAILPALQFATRAAEIMETSPAILYTDFIADIGPIVNCLEENGVAAVGYHREMDPFARNESYMNWKSAWYYLP